MRGSGSGSRQSQVDSRKSTVLVLAFFVVLVFLVVSGFTRTIISQQYTFEEVASGLKHRDASTRLRAIQILKDADYQEAAVPIAAALEDQDDRVQLAAIDAERSLFTSRPVARRKMVAFVIEVRSVAGGEAAAAGQLALKPRAVPAPVLTSLVVALRDNSPRVRAEAINLAALLGPVACQVRVAAPNTIGNSGPAQASRVVCDEIGNALVDNVNSREAAVRRAAMQALGQLRYANAVQALADQLSYHQSGPDALAALEGLAGIGHPTSVSTFEQLLSSSNADIRRCAVEGLARAGNREALPALQQMGQSEGSAGVLLALHYANAKLGDVDASLRELIIALGNSTQRLLAIGYLLDLSTTTATALTAALNDPNVDVRRLVADVLGFSRNPAVAPSLDAAAKDADPDVAAAAKQALVRLKL